METRNIWILGGQLYIGEENTPFTHEVRITLTGMQQDDTIDIDGIGDPGNKVLVNNGKVKLFGASRDRMSRLTAPVMPTASDGIFVETGLDWVQGDKLYFAPTAM